MKRLFFASTNEAKLLEFGALLGPLWVPKNLPPVEEDPLRYYVNARKKALALFFSLPSRLLADAIVIGEDSGLEIGALGGWPGPVSNRVAPDPAKIQLILDRLGETADRKARYVSVLSVIVPLPGKYRFQEHSISASLEGEISQSPSPVKGLFEYDRIFLVSGVPLSELPLEVRLRISHRAQAAMKVKAFLNSLP